MGDYDDLHRLAGGMTHVGAAMLQASKQKHRAAVALSGRPVPTEQTNPGTRSRRDARDYRNAGAGVASAAQVHTAQKTVPGPPVHYVPPPAARAAQAPVANPSAAQHHGVSPTQRLAIHRGGTQHQGYSPVRQAPKGQQPSGPAMHATHAPSARAAGLHPSLANLHPAIAAHALALASAEPAGLGPPPGPARGIGDSTGLGASAFDRTTNTASSSSSSSPGRGRASSQGAASMSLDPAQFRRTGKRTYCPINSSTTVTPGSIVSTPAIQPQLLFQPDELIIDATTAASFNLVALIIGVTPQAVAPGEVSCLNFPAQNGPKFAWDVADSGTQIVLQVHNTTTATTVAFTAMLNGDVLRYAQPGEE